MAARGPRFAVHPGMRRVGWCLFLLCLPACAIAFTPGRSTPPPPAKFQDTDESSHTEEQKTELATVDATPAFGMSLVVGGKPMDAGGLPKPPIPVVHLP